MVILSGCSSGRLKFESGTRAHQRMRAHERMRAHQRMRDESLPTYRDFAEFFSVCKN